MVFFNYATMQMAAKIVYYGPGLCGKTTNLHHIYTKTSPQSRGEMVSLETETDRTLFFDLLPIDVGVIGGFKTRLQLYTVPGQVFYNTTRKLVLKGVDGIVFVADSQRPMLDANAESFKNLRDNLSEIGLDLDEIPLVIQLNKRDLPVITTIDEMLNVLDPDRRHEHIESIAASGQGVFETLKLISKLTLRTLRRRMTGEEPVKAAPARTAQFRVKDDVSPARTIAQTARTEPIAAIGSTVATPSFSPTQAAAATQVAEPPTQLKAPETVEEIEELSDADVFTDSFAKTADVDTRILADAPVDEPPPSTQYIPPPSIAKSAPEIPPPPAVAPLAPVPPPITEPEIDFDQSEKPVKAPEPKHVKVRSSVDIMAELEALRKRATTSTQGPTPKPRKEMTAADVTIPTPKPKRDIHRALSMQLPADVAPRTKNVRVTVSFEGDNGVVKSEEQSIELSDASDVRSLTLDVKIALD